ncbi:hypothetical protein GALMADRAFT_220238 [Galerina marginata CBS 339.88]|uniref:DUF6534 domain-containing protein n=1 Tax=Galerina marginata (strain CBS 339.88) TaxID=685588 RepID=A0A067TQD4_GALM3|nr:hypothetical protein GALMADRAFT_220238 [Galerina marginata CBS 339.88]
MVTTLMAFSINTGNFCAIACLVTYALWPQRFIFMGLYFALSKLHINALLASLNARSTLLSHSYGMSTVSTSTPVTLTTNPTDDIDNNKPMRIMRDSGLGA